MIAIKEKITILTIAGLKKARKITALTAYDATFASLIDDAGIDIMLIGDSLGMVIGGHTTTIPVRLEDIIYHTKAVTSSRRRALVVADMPFMSFQVSCMEAVRNAGRMMKEGGAEAVKLEGGKPVLDKVRAIVETGIPVMGHLGLTPQSVHKFGGYKLQGRGEADAEAIARDALLLQDAGCFSIVLEKIPRALAAKVTTSLDIPTIGIGAGPECDGQILVLYDMLGFNEDFKPRFVKRYLEAGRLVRDAVSIYQIENRKQ